MERKTETKILLSDNVLELKKHVAVIHSSNKLTLLQRKIANALLFNAYKDLQVKDEHVIHISRLCEIIGYASNDHKTIKTALVNLISTVLEWNLVDGERLSKEVEWNASSIIAGASIHGAICTYSYSPQMKRLLYRPNVYGRLDMYVQARFQSTYGLALYENCNRFQDIGQTPWFTLLNFRKLMGVEEGKYKIFRDFKTRVLDKAIEEVNKYSPLEITAQLRKQNRQVVSVQFLIKKAKSVAINNDNVIEIAAANLRNILRKTFGFSMKQVDDAMVKYEEQYIQEKINLVQSSSSYKNAKVKNVAKYLLSALRDDYQPNKSSAPTTVVQNNFSHNIEMQTKFRRFQEAQLFKLFTQLPKKNKATTIKKFEKFLMGMYQQLYSREGLKNILIQEQLCIFLKKSNSPLLRQLMGFEEWVRMQ